MKQGRIGAPVAWAITSGVRSSHASRPRNLTRTRSRPKCRSKSIATIWWLARQRLICSAVSNDCRTSIVSAPSPARISWRMRLTVGLGSAIATIVKGMSRALRISRLPISQLPKCPVARIKPRPRASSDSTSARCSSALTNSARCSSGDPPSARRKSIVSRAYAAQGLAPDPFASGDVGIRQHRREIVGERRARARHHSVRQPGPGVADGVGQRPRQEPHAVIGRAEDQAVVESVKGPAPGGWRRRVGDGGHVRSMK